MSIKKIIFSLSLIFCLIAIKSQSYNPLAVAFFNRCTTPPDFCEKQLMSRVFDTLQHYNILDSLDVMYIFAQQTKQAAYLNLKNSSFTITESGVVKHDIDRGIYTAPTGFLSTNYNPNTDGVLFKLNYSSIGIYTLDNYVEAITNFNAGSSNGTSIVDIRMGNQANTALNSTAFSYNASYSYDNNGYACTVRNSNRLDFYRDGFSGYNVTNSAVAKPNYPIFIQCQNNSGTASNPKAVSRIAAFWAGGSLSALQNLKLYNILDYYLINVKAKNSAFMSEDTFIYYKAARIPPNKFQICVISQSPNGRYKLAGDINATLGYDSLYLSVDTGSTFSYRCNFNKGKGFQKLPWDGAIEFGHVFNNGTVLIATNKKEVWASYDLLANWTKIVVMNPDGSDYAYHSPVDTTHQGAYFTSFQSWGDYPNDMLIWGNYTNGDVFTTYGDAPNNIYYSADTGKTVKIAWKFKVQGRFNALGPDTIGQSKDTIRHVHSVSYQPKDTSYWAVIGDVPQPLYWLKGKYNYSTKLWTWVKNNSSDQQALQVVGLQFYEDSVLYVREYATGFDTTKIGIWKCAYSDLLNFPVHRKIYAQHPVLTQGGGGLLWDGTKIVSGYYIGGNYSVIISNNNGRTFKKVSIPIMNITNNCIFYKADPNGWYLVNPYIGINSNYFLKIK